MTCLQLCVLFDCQICGTFSPVLMNIFLRSRLTLCKWVVVLSFSDHGEFETVSTLALIVVYLEYSVLLIVYLSLIIVYDIPYIKGYMKYLGSKLDYWNDFAEMTFRFQAALVGNDCNAVKLSNHTH